MIWNWRKKNNFNNMKIWGKSGMTIMIVKDFFSRFCEVSSPLIPVTKNRFLLNKRHPLPEVPNLCRNIWFVSCIPLFTPALIAIWPCICCCFEMPAPPCCYGDITPWVAAASLHLEVAACNSLLLRNKAWWHLQE